MKCQNFLNKHCLSCDLLSQEYLASIKIKEQKLAGLFPEHLNVIKPSVACAQGTEGTRNKAKLAVALVQGEVTFGFYDNHLQFKKLEDCPLHAPNINTLLITLKQQLSFYKIIPYDVFSKKGELKYVLITFSESTNELLLRFVLRSTESLGRLKKLTSELLATNSNIKVVTANIQPVHQAVLEGEEEIVLTEVDCIAHQFDDYYLFQGPRSFFQTNTDMALKLYRQFQHELSALSVNAFLDLYCGVGAFAFFASAHCHNITGVEISDAAIVYANKARERNRAQYINFVAMDVDMFLQNQSASYFDAILVNPPRRGLNNSIIQHLLRLAPNYLFYSSCNADSLKRDILQLEEKYQLQSLQLFDMFPFTSHFETLAILIKS